MKKFSWKLLLVVALIAVLIGCMVACNKTPNEPADPPVYEEPADPDDAESVFFTELYNVSRGIGNEKVGADKNVYVEADLGLELGTKSGATANSFALGIALKAVLDRNGDDKNDTALNLDLTSGTKTILGVCYTAADKMAYVTLGDQKVKINTALVDLGSLIGGLFDTEIKSGFTVNDLIDDITKEMEGKWSLDNLIKYILTEFGLKDTVAGVVQGLPGNIGANLLDRDGNLSLLKVITDPTVQGLFTADNNTAQGKYSAKATSSVIIDALKGALKAGAKDGLDLKVSFGAKDHILTSGVKVELELSPEGATQKPFAAISINHLRIKEAGKQAAYTVAAPTGEYKENLQLQVKEEIAISGIKIGAGNQSSTLPKHIELGLLANLDLVNETNNQTKVRFYLNQTVEDGVQKIKSQTQDPTTYTTTIEYEDLGTSLESIFDFTYAGGRLTYTFNPSADLVPGYFGWASILHNPLGNLVKDVIAKADPARAETFIERYNHQVQGSGAMSGKVYDFKGLVIDNLNFADVLNLLFAPKQDAAATSEEPVPAPQETVSPKNFVAGIAKIFSLLSTSGDGKFELNMHGLLEEALPIVQSFGLTNIPGTETPLTKNNLITWLKDFVAGLEGFGFVVTDGIINFDGFTVDKASDVDSFVQRLQHLFDATDSGNGNVKFKFDVADPTNGLYWELDWLAQDNEEQPAQYGDVSSFMKEEKHKYTQRSVEDIRINYKSSIKFNEQAVEVAADEFTELFEKKALYEEGIAAAQKTLDDATAAAVPNTEAYNTTKATYEATKAYKDYLDAQDKYTKQKAASLEILNGYKTESTWFTATIGKNITNLYYQGSASNSSKALYKWVKAGEVKDESKAEYQAVKAIIDNALQLLETNKAKLANDPEKANQIYERWKKAWDMDGTDNLWTAHLAECKALIAQEDAKKAAEATNEYKAYNDANTAKKTTDKAVSDAQAAVDALEDPYFVYFYWDLKAEA